MVVENDSLATLVRFCCSIDCAGAVEEVRRLVRRRGGAREGGAPCEVDIELSEDTELLFAARRAANAVFTDTSEMFAALKPARPNASKPPTLSFEMNDAIDWNELTV